MSNNMDSRKNDMMDGLIGLMIGMRAEVVRSLLAGNDTCCFTAEQYRQAYESKWRRASNSHYGCQPLSDELIAMHLRSTGLVREVSPGVWAEGRETMTEPQAEPQKDR
jgi:hypothetical protein